jgi:16S rRNA processing protein RimM
MERDLCPIGRVVKPHGVRGKIKVAYFGVDLGRFPLYEKIFIKDNLGKPELYEVLEVTPQPPRLILKLKGIDRIEETENLIGKEILVPREDFPQPEEGEYYWYEIIGMVVETEKGRRLGTVKEIFPTGANDVYVVEGKRGEIFLPATDGVIRSIDRQRRVIRVLRMEGLWEEDDEI